MDNLILHTDSYKFSHHLQYPPNTTNVFSYVESRGGAEEGLVFFGLQACIKKYLMDCVTAFDVDEAEQLAVAHGLPFNRSGWDAVRTRGYLPVRIRALPEGTVVRSGIPLMTIENTTPDSYWLPCFLETLLLRGIWYPTTVATVSWRIKNLIRGYLETNGDPTGLDFKLHDFGARGVSSGESASIGGMAHLVNFKGSDTVEALVAARKYYHEPMAGFSIPAAEHSTITSWLQKNESHAYANMVDQFSKPGALFAVVSDSYDIFNAVSEIWGKELKDKLLGSGGTLVVRPDSGTPWLVVHQVMKTLYDKFGGKENSKGRVVLNPHVRVIQGDGINEESIGKILSVLDINGFSADNIAFGMGGALLQHMNRDTYQFAMKACAAKVDGEWRRVFKEPITDSRKNSKSGLLDTVYDVQVGWAYRDLLLKEAGPMPSQMRTVYENGNLLIDETFTTIRSRANGTHLGSEVVRSLTALDVTKQEAGVY